MIEASNVADQAGIGRFIPAESANRIAVVKPAMGWNEKLVSLTNKVDRADTQANIARHRKWLTAMRFFIGEQLGFVNDAGAWQTITRNPGDPIYVVNLLQYFVGALLKDYVRSQAVLDVSARGGRLDMRLAARPASEMLKIIQQDQMGPTAIERDGKFNIILGNTFRYTVCTAAIGQYRKEPVTEKIRIQLTGSSAICLDCGGVSEMPEMPEQPQDGDDVGQQMCQQCGSTQTEIVQGAATDITQIKGFEERRTPDVQTTIVDPFEIKLPISAENEILAGWLRRERFVDDAKMRASFPWAEMTESASLYNGETPLLAQMQIQQSPGNVGGHVTGYNTTPAQMDLRRFRQYWFRPEEYFDYVFEQPEVLANGETIPAGTRAMELFPNGLYVAKCGGTILEVADENKADAWVHNRWDVVPDAIWGYGIDHVIQAQEINNEIFSLVYEHIMHNTTPPVVLDPNYLHRSDWSNKPGMIAMLRKGAPTGGVGNAYSVAQGRPMGSDTFGFMELIKGDMQLLSGGAFSTASGLPDVHTDTLGGMQIQRDQALAQHVSKLNRKAEADCKTGKQQLRIVKKHNLAQFYFPRLSDFSEYELQMFDQADIDADFDIRGRPGSQFPRSELEKRGDLEAALMAGGLPLGIFNPQMPRNIMRIALELYNFPSLGEQMAADERNALLNIVHLMEFAELASNGAQEQGIPPADPEQALVIAANVAPVRYRVDDAATCVNTIVEFMKTDAGRHLSPMAELLINDLMTRYKKGAVMKMMEDAQNPTMINPLQPDVVPGSNPADAMAAQQQAAQPGQPGIGGQSQAGPPQIGGGSPGAGASQKSAQIGSKAPEQPLARGQQTFRTKQSDTNDRGDRPPA